MLLIEKSDICITLPAATTTAYISPKFSKTKSYNPSSQSQKKELETTTTTTTTTISPQTIPMKMRRRYFGITRKKIHPPPPPPFAISVERQKRQSTSRLPKNCHRSSPYSTFPNDVTIPKEIQPKKTISHFPVFPVTTR